MKEIKETVEKVIGYESEDGKFSSRITGGVYSKEMADECKEKVKDYEESMSAVLFKRLVDRGVLRKLPYKFYTLDEMRKLSAEEVEENDLACLTDYVLNNSCGDYAYYLYEPKTEEDLKDLLIYAKADCGGISFSNWFEFKYQGSLHCAEEDVVVGRRYICAEHCDGFKYLYDIDWMKDRLAKWFDWLAKK